MGESGEDTQQKDHGQESNPGCCGKGLGPKWYTLYAVSHRGTPVRELLDRFILFIIEDN